MKIKVCGLADAANLEAVARCRPDCVGFVFYAASARCATNCPGLREAAVRLRGVKKVGVFVNASRQDIHDAVADFGLDLLQLHGDESPAFCESLRTLKPVIKAFPIGADPDFRTLADYEESCRYFLFDTASAQRGGSGQTFDWALLERYTLPTPFFLSGGIGPGQAAALKSLSHPALWGVDVNSRFETAPGTKNISSLQSFFHELRH